MPPFAFNEGQRVIFSPDQLELEAGTILRRVYYPVDTPYYEVLLTRNGRVFCDWFAEETLIAI